MIFCLAQLVVANTCGDLTTYYDGRMPGEPYTIETLKECPLTRDYLDLQASSGYAVWRVPRLDELVSDLPSASSLPVVPHQSSNSHFATSCRIAKMEPPRVRACHALLSYLDAGSQQPVADCFAVGGSDEEVFSCLSTTWSFAPKFTDRGGFPIETVRRVDRFSNNDRVVKPRDPVYVAPFSELIAKPFQAFVDFLLDLFPGLTDWYKAFRLYLSKTVEDYTSLPITNPKACTPAYAPPFGVRISKLSPGDHAPMFGYGYVHMPGAKCSGDRIIGSDNIGYPGAGLMVLTSEHRCGWPVYNHLVPMSGDQYFSAVLVGSDCKPVGHGAIIKHGSNYKLITALHVQRKSDFVIFGKSRTDNSLIEVREVADFGSNSVTSDIDVFISSSRERHVPGVVPVPGDKCSFSHYASGQLGVAQVTVSAVRDSVVYGAPDVPIDPGASGSICVGKTHQNEAFSLVLTRSGSGRVELVAL